MNLLELVTHLRTNILHDRGGQGADWATFDETDFDSIQLRWKNEELTANINEAINQVYRRLEPVRVLTTLAVTATNHTYSLPASTIQVERVKRADGEEVTEKDIRDFWGLRDFNTDTGPIIHYFTDLANDTIRLYRVPEANETLDLLVSRYPTSSLSWASNTTTPELRSAYHLPMLFYAAHLCYLKDEANTLDPQRANTFLSMFDREFPFTSVYSNVRKGRTSNRPIKYGGL